MSFIYLLSRNKKLKGIKSDEELTFFDELIVHMKGKGIQFNLTDEAAAKVFLQENLQEPKTADTL